MDTVTVFFIYKGLILIVGAFVIYLGYRLFMKGINSSAGDMTTSAGSFKLNLSRAAPGTFFALFGALIITVAVYKKYKVDSGEDMVEDKFSVQKTLSDTMSAPLFVDPTKKK